MEMRAEITRVALSPGETMVLDSAAGIELICRGGCVWITQYGDRRDIVLGAGQSFELTRPAGVVMSAAQGADLILRPLATTRAGVAGRGWLARLAGLFDPRGSRRVHRALEGRARFHRVA